MNQRKDALLGTEPIGPLLARMSIPAIVGMIVNATYNVVDAIFLGRGVGTMAIGGLAVAFPFQLIMMAFAILIGIGSASVISRNLGAGNRERAAETAGNAFALSLVIGAVLMVLGYTFLDPLMRLLGSTGELTPYVREYITYILPGSVFIMFAIAANSIVRAEGRATFAMITMVIGIGMNIVLDPIFIFALGMGIKGAAIATVIAQFISFLVLLVFFISGRSALELKFSHLKFRASVLGETLKLGLPMFVHQFGASILVVIINNSLGTYGTELSIAIFGILNRLIAFFLMPLLGLSQGFQPIAGYNYGARRYERVRKTVRLTLSVATAGSTFFFLVMMLFPGFLIGLFTDDALLVREAVPIIRTVILAVPLVGLQVVGSTYFQAVGKAVPAFILGLSRQVLFLIPLVAVLPLIMGIRGVWTAFPIADILAVTVTAVWITREYRGLGRLETQSGVPEPGSSAPVPAAPPVGTAQSAPQD